MGTISIDARESWFTSASARAQFRCSASDHCSVRPDQL
jgi:hypothetical protein